MQPIKSDTEPIPIRCVEASAAYVLCPVVRAVKKTARGVADDDDRSAHANIVVTPRTRPSSFSIRAAAESDAGEIRLGERAPAGQACACRAAGVSGLSSSSSKARRIRLDAGSKGYKEINIWRAVCGGSWPGRQVCAPALAWRGLRSYVEDETAPYGTRTHERGDILG